MSKFVVVNKKDLEKLSEHQIVEFERMLEVLATDNEYYVVNKDEPYIYSIESTIFANERKVKCPNCGYEGSYKDFKIDAESFFSPMRVCPRCKESRTHNNLMMLETREEFKKGDRS